MATVPDRMFPVGVLEGATIPGLLAQQAEQRLSAPAILCPGRTPLSHGRLWEQISSVGAQLRQWGIGTEDRVALVLPTGPELAVAGLSVACTAAVVVLNPDYGPDDFASTLSMLRVKAVIVPAEEETPVVAVARGMGLAVLTLTPVAEGDAGLFTLAGEALGPAVTECAVRSETVALVSFTSGTTSRPKVVPLTHRVLCARALVPGRTPTLTPDDRELNFSRLYGSGPSGLLVSLLSGGAVICPRDLSVDTFFRCLDECQPTWCRTVPPVAQAIVAQGQRYMEKGVQHRLRYIAIGSAALPPQVKSGLEELLHVLVLPSYSMTEAIPIARTPVPPRPYKIGSVGVTQGLDVAIMDEHGTLLATGQTGEVVVRGPTVISGYEDNPEANRQAFREGGWFRTGDAGYLDEDGYLFLTGRFKEMINRGGEKVAPLEVENAILEHQAVAQAVAFALPHTTLGEDVGAAVVLRGGMTATERELRVFVGDRLAAFKVPRRIVFLDEMPVSAAGKVQRIGMAERLGLDTVQTPDYVSPRDVLERMVAGVWAEVLGHEQVGTHDNFFDLGGNSLQAAQVVAALAPALGRKVPAGVLLEAPTVAEMAELLRQTEGAVVLPTLVALQPEGTRPPLFCVAYLGGPALGFRQFAAGLGPDQPLYVLQEARAAQRDALPRSIEEIAAEYVEAVRDVQAHGPYYLVGNSSGGAVVFEMAQQFHARGERVALLLLLDAYCPLPVPSPTWSTRVVGPLQFRVHAIAAKVRHRVMTWQTLPVGERPAYMREGVAGLQRRFGVLTGHVTVREDDQAVAAREQVMAEARDRRRPRYVPRPYAGRIVFFWSSDNPRGRQGAVDPRLGWRRVAEGGLEIHRLPGGHSDFTYYTPYMRQMITELQACLRRARRTGEMEAPDPSAGGRTGRVDTLPGL